MAKIGSIDNIHKLLSLEVTFLNLRLTQHVETKGERSYFLLAKEDKAFAFALGVKFDTAKKMYYTLKDNPHNEALFSVLAISNIE